MSEAPLRLQLGYQAIANHWSVRTPDSMAAELQCQRIVKASPNYPGCPTARNLRAGACARLGLLRRGWHSAMIYLVSSRSIPVAATILLDSAGVLG